MTKRINVISNVSITAYCTCIGCITLFCASRRCYNYFIVVTKCRDNLLCNKNLAAGATLLTLGKTGGCTSGSTARKNFLYVVGIGAKNVATNVTNIIVIFVFVTKCGNDCGKSAKFFAAYSAVNNCLVATCRGAVRCHVVFNYCFACSVTLSGNNGGKSAKLVATYGAVNNCVITACIGAVRINIVFNHCFACSVTLSRNGNGYSVEFIAAFGAVGYIVIVTVVDTIRINVVFNNNFAFGMTECRYGNGFSAEFFSAFGAVDHIVIVTVIGAVRSNVVFYNNFACGVTHNGECLGYDSNNVIVALSVDNRDGIYTGNKFINGNDFTVCIDVNDFECKFKISILFNGNGALRNVFILVDCYVLVNGNGKLCGFDHKSCMRYNRLVDYGIGKRKDFIRTCVYRKLAVQYNSCACGNSRKLSLKPFDCINCLSGHAFNCCKIIQCLIDCTHEFCDVEICHLFTGGDLLTEVTLDQFEDVHGIGINHNINVEAVSVNDDRDKVGVQRIIGIHKLFVAIENNLCVFQIEFKISLGDYQETLVGGRLVIGIDYDTVIEVVAGNCVGDVVSECERYVFRELSKLSDKSVNVNVFAKSIRMSSQEINEVILVDTVLKELILSKILVKPSGEVNVYVAIECIKANAVDVTGKVHAAGDKNVIRLKSGNGRTGFNVCCMTVAVVLNFATGNFDGRAGKIDHERTNACAIVTHFAVEILNVDSNDFVNTCVNRSFARVVRFAIGLETHVDESKFTLSGVDNVAFKVGNRYVYVLAGVIKFGFKIFNLNLGVAGSNHNRTSDQVADVDFVVQNKLNVRKLNERAVGKVFSRGIDYKIAIGINANEQVSNLLGCFFIERAISTVCRCKKIDIRKKVASEDAVCVGVVPLEVNLSELRSDYKQTGIDCGNVVGIGYNRSNYVDTDFAYCKVIRKGKLCISRHLVQRGDHAVDNLRKSIQNVGSCAFCFKSSKDFGKLFVQLIRKRANGYTMCSNVRSVGCKDRINPCREINVHVAANCAPAVNGCTNSANTCGNDGGIRFQTFNSRACRYLIVGIVRFAGNVSFDLVFYVNVRFGGKNHKNANICADRCKIKEFVEVFNGQFVKLFKIKSKVTIIEAKVGNKSGVNTCVYRLFFAVVELTVRLDTDVANDELCVFFKSNNILIVVTIDDIAVGISYDNAKALRLIVKFLLQLVVRRAGGTNKLNVNRAGSDDERTNDRDRVVKFVAPQNAVGDLYVCAVVLNVIGINPKVSLDLTVDIHGKEFAGIGVDTKNEVLDSKILDGITHNVSALIHSVPCGKRGKAVKCGVPTKLNFVVLGRNDEVICGVCGFVVGVNGNCACDVYTDVLRMEFIIRDDNLDIHAVGDTCDSFHNLIEDLNRAFINTKRIGKLVDQVGKFAQSEFTLEVVTNERKISDHFGKSQLNEGNCLTKTNDVLLFAKVSKNMHVKTDHEFDQLGFNRCSVAMCNRTDRNFKLIAITISDKLRIVVDRNGSLVHSHVKGDLARLVGFVTCKEQSDCVITCVHAKILSVNLKTVNQCAVCKYTCAGSGDQVSDAVTVGYGAVICLNFGCDTVILDGNVGYNLSQCVLVVSIADADGFGRAVAFRTELVRAKGKSLQLVFDVRISIGNTNFTGTDLFDQLVNKLISKLFKVVFLNLGINVSPKLAKLNVKRTKLKRGKAEVDFGKCDGYLALGTSEVFEFNRSKVDIGGIADGRPNDFHEIRCLNTVCEIVNSFVIQLEFGINRFNLNFKVILFGQIEREGHSAVVVVKLNSLRTVHNFLFHAVDEHLNAIDGLRYVVNNTGCQREDVGTVTDNCVKFGCGIPVHRGACLVGYVHSGARNGNLNGSVIGNVGNGNAIEGFLARLVVFGTVVGYDHRSIVAMIKNFNGVVYVVLNVNECAVCQNAKTHRTLEVFDQLSFFHVLNRSGGNGALYVGCGTKVNQSEVSLYSNRIVGLVIVSRIPCDTDSYRCTVVESKESLIGNSSPCSLCNVGREFNRPCTAVGCDKVCRIVLAKDLVYNFLSGRNFCVITCACLIHKHLSRKLSSVKLQNVVFSNDLIFSIFFGCKGYSRSVGKGITNAAKDVIPVNKLAVATLKRRFNEYQLTVNVFVNFYILNIRSSFGVGLVVKLFKNSTDVITRGSESNGQSITLLEVGNTLEGAAVSTVLHREVVLCAGRSNCLNRNSCAVAGVEYVQSNFLFKRTVLVIRILDADSLSSVLTKLVSQRTKVNCRTLGDILPQVVTTHANVSVLKRYVSGSHRSGRTAENTAKYQSLQFVVGQIVIVHAIYDRTILKSQVVLRVGCFNRINVSDFGTVGVEGDGSILRRIADLIGVEGSQNHAVLVNGDGFNNVGAAGLHGDRNGGVTCNGSAAGQRTARRQRVTCNNSAVVQEGLYIVSQGCRTANVVSVVCVSDGINHLDRCTCRNCSQIALNLGIGDRQTIGVYLSQQTIQVVCTIVVFAQFLHVGYSYVNQACRRTGVLKSHCNCLGVTGLGVGDGKGVRVFVQLISQIAIIEQPISAFYNLNTIVINFNSPSSPIAQRLNTNNSSNGVLAVSRQARSLQNLSTEASQRCRLRLVGIPLIYSNSTIGSSNLTAILCGIGYVTGNGSDGLIPTGEGVLHTVSSSLVSRALEAGCFVVIIGFGGGATTGNPSYGVASQNLGKGCRIGNISGSNRDRAPSTVGEVILRSRGLRRGGSHGHCAVFHGSCGSSIAVHPGNGILVDLVSRLNGHILSRHSRGNSGIPALEGITGSGRISRCRDGSSIILCQSSDYVIIPVNECDRVLVNSPLCSNGNILCRHSSGDFLIPACKSITGSGRISRCRNGGVVILLDRFVSTVSILKGNGVLIDLPLCGEGHVSIAHLHTGGEASPALEGVTGLGRRGRSSNGCAVFILNLGFHTVNNPSSKMLVDGPSSGSGYVFAAHSPTGSVNRAVYVPTGKGVANLGRCCGKCYRSAKLLGGVVQNAVNVPSDLICVGNPFLNRKGQVFRRHIGRNNCIPTAKRMVRLNGNILCNRRIVIIGSSVQNGAVSILVGYRVLIDLPSSGVGHVGSAHGRNHCRCPAGKRITGLGRISRNGDLSAVSMGVDGLVAVNVPSYGVLVHSPSSGVGHVLCAHSGNHSRSPAGEGVAFLGGVSRNGDLSAVSMGVGGLVAVNVPSYGVVVHRPGCSIGNRAGDSDDFFIPTSEGMTFLSGSCTGVGRNGAVFHFTRLNRVAVAVNEGYSVLVNRTVKLCSIGSRTGDSNNFLIPTLEGVGVLRSCSLGGSCTGVFRSFTVFHFTRLNRVAVTVHPGDGVLFYHSIIGSSIGSLTGNRVDLGIPTGKGVASNNVAVRIYLIFLGSGRSHDLISSRTVGVSLFRQYGTVVVLKGYVVNLNFPNNFARKCTVGSKPGFTAVSNIPANSIGVNLALNRIQRDGQTSIRLNVGACAVGHVDRIQNRSLKISKRVLLHRKLTERNLRRLTGVFNVNMTFPSHCGKFVRTGPSDSNLFSAGHFQPERKFQCSQPVRNSVQNRSILGVDPTCPNTKVNVDLNSILRDIINVTKNSLNNVILKTVQNSVFVMAVNTCNVIVLALGDFDRSQLSRTVGHCYGIFVVVCNIKRCGINSSFPRTRNSNSIAVLVLNDNTVHVVTTCRRGNGKRQLARAGRTGNSMTVRVSQGIATLVAVVVNRDVTRLNIQLNRNRYHNRGFKISIRLGEGNSHFHVSGSGRAQRNVLVGVCRCYTCRSISDRIQSSSVNRAVNVAVYKNCATGIVGSQVQSRAKIRELNSHFCAVLWQIAGCRPCQFNTAVAAIGIDRATKSVIIIPFELLPTLINRATIQYVDGRSDAGIVTRILHNASNDSSFQRCNLFRSLLIAIHVNGSTLKSGNIHRHAIKLDSEFESSTRAIRPNFTNPSRLITLISCIPSPLTQTGITS